MKNVLASRLGIAVVGALGALCHGDLRLQSFDYAE